MHNGMTNLDAAAIALGIGLVPVFFWCVATFINSYRLTPTRVKRNRW